MPTLTPPRDLAVPPRLTRRPRDARGYLVPWFVAVIDGVFEFRVMDAEKRQRAVRDRLCWMCGERLGRHKAFVVGPMCAVNRTSSEPPCHLDCALYAVAACPFLTRPHARRRAAGLPEEADSPGGIGIDRNPGVTLVWVTARYDLQRTFAADGGGVVDGWVLRMGDPITALAYAEGRVATADELWTSIVTGYPFLAATAQAQGHGAGPALRTHLHLALTELANLRLVTADHLRRTDAEMPPVED